MEEEKKEVVEEVKAEQADEINSEANLKNVLVSFIVSVAGWVFSWSGIVLMICGIVGLNFLKKVPGQVTKAPHKVFQKIAKPVAIVDIILGALITLGLIVWLIVWIALVAAGVWAASQGA